MWFGEPLPFPERGSPTRLCASGQQSYKGWSCRSLNLTQPTRKTKALSLSWKCRSIVEEVGTVTPTDRTRQKCYPLRTCPNRIGLTLIFIGENTLWVFWNKLLRKAPEANDEGVREHCNVLYCPKGGLWSRVQWARRIQGVPNECMWGGGVSFL